MRKTAKIFLAAALFCAAFFVGKIALAADWKSVNLESVAAGAASDVSISVDSNDKLHVCYAVNIGAGFVLKYATNVSGSWQTETIDASGSAGLYPHIFIDNYDKAHVSYYDATNGDLKYANNTQGYWASAIVDSTGDVGKFSSLAVTYLGAAHISYYDATNGDLKYANNASGSWALYSLSAEGDTGLYTSLALDILDAVYISYHDATNSSLHFITNNSGNWQAAIVDEAQNVGPYSSLALDSHGDASISYYDATNGDLKYATNESGTWAYVTPDSTNDVGMLSTLKMDQNDKARIAYYDRTAGNIKYVTNLSGTWKVHTIASVGDLTGAEFSSFFLTKDSNNKMYVGYYSHSGATSGEVSYVYTPGPTKYVLKINAGSDYTLSRKVDLRFSAKGSPTEMMFSKKQSLDDASWLDYKTTKTITLKSGLGTKKVYAKLRDEWYAETLIFYDDIRLLTRAKFVTRKAGKNEILVNKKNRLYTGYDFMFAFKNLPSRLKAGKFFVEIKKFNKYPEKYINANAQSLKKYWKLTTNLNTYRERAAKDKYKIKMVFKYTDAEFKALKKKSSSLSESQLALKYYNASENKWVNASATHNLKKNTFSVIAASPIPYNVIDFTIGVK